MPGVGLQNAQGMVEKERKKRPTLEGCRCRYKEAEWRSNIVELKI